LVFITINLFNFILCFLNNFFWTNLEKNTITDEMNPSAFDSTFTNAFTDGYIRSVFHTLIDKITDKLNPSAFDSSCHYYRRLYRRMYSVGISNTHWQIYRQYIAVGKSWYHRRIFMTVYFKRENFFWCANSVCKTIGKWFFCFSDRYSDGMRNHRRRESWRT